MELRNRAILNYIKNIVCIAMWSLVTHSDCLEWDLLKEQTVINLSAMLLLKVCLHLILFILLYYYTIKFNTDYMDVTICLALGKPATYAQR